MPAQKYQNVLIAEQDRVSIMSPDAKGYAEERSFVMPGTKQVLASGDALYAFTKNTATRFSAELEKKSSISYGRISAAVAGEEHIYLVADGALRILDQNLRQSGVLELACSGARTAPRDIIIHDDIAYLSDNTCNPPTLLRADIRHPAKPKLIGEFKVKEPGLRVEAQWLNPPEGQRLVLASSLGESGTSQKVLIYPIGEGDSAAKREIFSSSWDGTRKGYEIKGVTPVPPLWTMVRDEENRPHMARMDTRRSKISFSAMSSVLPMERHHDTSDLEDDDWGNISLEETVIIRPADDALYVSAQGAHELRIVLLGDGEITEVIPMDLKGIKAVTDMVPIRSA